MFTVFSGASIPHMVSTSVLFFFFLLLILHILVRYTQNENMGRSTPHRLYPHLNNNIIALCKKIEPPGFSI